MQSDSRPAAALPTSPPGQILRLLLLLVPFCLGGHEARSEPVSPDSSAGVAASRVRLRTAGSKASAGTAGRGRQGIRGSSGDDESAPVGTFPVFEVAGAAGSPYGPAVEARDDGSFVVVWSADRAGDYDIDTIGRRFASDGTALGSEFLVNAHTAGRQSDAAIGSAPDGSFVVVWNDSAYPGEGLDGSGYGLFGRRFSSDGTPAGTDFQVNTTTLGDQRVSSIGVGPTGDFTVVWGDTGDPNSPQLSILGQRFAADGTPDGMEFQAAAPPFPSGQVNFQAGVSPAGSFAVAWQDGAFDSDGQDGSQGGILAQSFASDGSAVTAAFQVNTVTLYDQSSPSIGVGTNGEFLVTWLSVSAAEPNDPKYLVTHRGQRYTSDGTPVGTEFLVTEGGAPSGIETSVGPDGRIVVAFANDYETFPNDGSFWSKRYDSEGSLVDPLTSINGPGRFANQWSVSAGAKGSFVVAWWDFEHDRIRARGFGPPVDPATVSAETRTSFGFRPGIDLALGDLSGGSWIALIFLTLAVTLRLKR